MVEKLGLKFEDTELTMPPDLNGDVDDVNVIFGGVTSEGERVEKPTETVTAEETKERDYWKEKRDEFVRDKMAKFAIEHAAQMAGNM